LRTSRQHPILQKGLVRPGKAEDYFSTLSFLPSADLDLNENQGRIDKTTNNGDDNSGNNEKSDNLSFAF
jgi:hypothetical protein